MRCTHIFIFRGGVRGIWRNPSIFINCAHLFKLIYLPTQAGVGGDSGFGVRGRGGQGVGSIGLDAQGLEGI